MIISSEKVAQGSVEADVCVIGSGAGGAAAAWKLASLGLKVVCLEAGGHYTEADFSQDLGRAMPQLYEEDGHRVMKGNVFVPLPGGRCLGGSTVINSGICFRIPQWRFEEWSESSSLDFSYEEFLPHLIETEQMIGVAPSNPAIFGENNAFCLEGLQALGWSGGPMPRNAPGCVGCGSCITGCPSGAKLSVAKTFIPQAVQLGADFYTHASVRRFLYDGTQVVGAVAELLDPQTEEPLGELAVRSRAVVLAAGAIQSPALLQANGLGNEHVGEHLHVHIAAGTIGITDRQIQAWKGIPQGFYSDEFVRSDRMILESFWATPDVYFTFFPFGIDGTDAMFSYDQMVGLGGIVADTSEGQVRLPPGAKFPRIRYDVNRTDKERLVRLQRRVCELLIAAGAHDLATGIYGVPPLSTMDEVMRWLQPAEIRIKQMTTYASHPHGSVRMGQDPSFSAVDSSGGLHGRDGLYVMDASIFPDVLGVNPQVTIMALALFLSERLGQSLS